MRVRLREDPSEDELKELYGQPYDHMAVIPHKLRVSVTRNLCHWIQELHHLTHAADLSCGDGAVLQGLYFNRIYLGDYTPNRWEYSGPIDQTIHLIPHVDLFVSSETLEHVPDPDGMLKAIRHKTDWLILSTPVEPLYNPEHIWGWDKEEVESMLAGAEFHPTQYIEIWHEEGCPRIGIWAAR